ncbi:DUF2971 domain-containing protein [Paenibacillus bovis]|uniref:DUF2971 domain-containing protein n=1 Tax=Paenibacillus bovis TaxID=1616788 RepID=A0A1X9T483_9BACL|nr:DUF2971 domain-containing protein [Paenibacillus bovis]ARR10780.1 hypothetical protein AR543_p0172 [Paenibacillus bovis]
MPEEDVILDRMHEVFNEDLGEHQLINENFDNLYHYTSIQGLEGIVTYGCFWVTHVKFMNDSSENSYFWGVLKEVIDDFAKMHPENSVRKGFVAELNKVMDIHTKVMNVINHYVLSFSTQSDSLSMWNYYGKNDGYCLGFSKNEIIEVMNKLNDDKNVDLVLTAQVIYDKEVQVNILRNELENVYKWFLENKDNNQWKDINNRAFSRGIASYAIERFATYASFFKHPAFRDEGEFRVYIRQTMFDNPANYRPYQGIIIPYIKVNIKKNNEEIPLESINVGPLIKHDLAVEGLERWLSTQSLTKPIDEIKLTQSNIPIRF